MKFFLSGLQVGNLILRLRKVGARSGQARSGHGPGKVGARLGQGLDKKQGSGKVWGLGKVRARFGQVDLVLLVEGER